jgi:hypothetical protein
MTSRRMGPFRRNRQKSLFLPRLGRFVRLVTCLVILLAVGASVIGVHRYSSNLGPKGFTHIGDPDTEELRNAEREFHQKHPDLPLTALLVQVVGVDPSGHNIEANLSVKFSSRHDPSLMEDPNRELKSLRDFHADTLEQRLLFMSRQGNQLNLRLRITGSAEQSLPIRLIEPFGTGDDSSAPTRRRVKIPAQVFPQAFPNERYLVSDFVDLVPSKPLQLDSGDRLFELPLIISISVGQELSDWRQDRIAVRSPHWDEEIQILDPPLFEIELFRASEFTNFIVGVIFLPTLMFFTFTIAALSQAGNGKDATSPLELATALLATIALRQVLVPPEIPGLTYVDRLLAGQAIAIALGTCGIHILLTMPRSGKVIESQDPIVRASVVDKALATDGRFAARGISTVDPSPHVIDLNDRDDSDWAAPR